MQSICACNEWRLLLIWLLPRSDLKRTSGCPLCRLLRLVPSSFVLSLAVQVSLSRPLHFATFNIVAISRAMTIVFYRCNSSTVIIIWFWHLANANLVMILRSCIHLLLCQIVLVSTRESHSSSRNPAWLIILSFYIFIFHIRVVLDQDVFSYLKVRGISQRRGHPDNVSVALTLVNSLGSEKSGAAGVLQDWSFVFVLQVRLIHKHRWVFLGV